MFITRDKLRNITPKFLLLTYRKMRSIYYKIKYNGNSFYCNICNSNLRSWTYYGPQANLNFTCPICNSFGRHRIMGIILEKNLHNDEANYQKKLLHFAPEIGLQTFLKKNFPQLEYKSSNFESNDADLNLNLMNIDLPDNSVDYIILIHVLEHIEDDIVALNELKRILAPNGKLFIQVPLSKNKITLEKKFNLAEERLTNYGQKDHLRLYSINDLHNKLLKIGYTVSIHMAQDDEYKLEFHRMALDLPKESKMLYSSESTVLICQKSIN